MPLAPPDYRDETRLLDSLRAGDDRAFEWLLDRYHSSLVRVARRFVASDAHAEEVAQETWLAVIRGIDRFEGRSSVKTWIYRILLNIARRKGVNEHRAVPFSSLATASDEGLEATFEPGRFRPPGDPWAGHWISFPLDWEHEPESRLLSGEVLELVAEAVLALPPAQREVLTLRDLEGWSSAEVCEALELTEVNQRVLLHRGRAKVRRALESYFESSVTR